VIGGGEETEEILVKKMRKEELCHGQKRMTMEIVAQVFIHRKRSIFDSDNSENMFLSV